MPSIFSFDWRATVYRDSGAINSMGEPTRNFDVVVLPEIGVSVQYGKVIWKLGDPSGAAIQTVTIFMNRIYDPDGNEIQPQTGDVFWIWNQLPVGTGFHVVTVFTQGLFLVINAHVGDFQYVPAS